MFSPNTLELQIFFLILFTTSLSIYLVIQLIFFSCNIAESSCCVAYLFWLPASFAECLLLKTHSLVLEMKPTVPLLQYKTLFDLNTNSTEIQSRPSGLFRLTWLFTFLTGCHLQMLTMPFTNLLPDHWCCRPSTTPCRCIRIKKWFFHKQLVPIYQRDSKPSIYCVCY